jgi:GNAT superfamily N-acetyltransferase
MMMGAMPTTVDTAMEGVRIQLRPVRTMGFSMSAPQGAWGPIDLAMLPFSDRSLCRRLEQTEGNACAQYATARRRLFPDSGAEWIQCAGTYVVFDGVNSPVTQTFGLGVFAPVTPRALDTIEKFFCDRGAPVCHEVSPFAGVEALDLLCRRNYRPVELSTVLYKKVEQPGRELASHIQIRIAESTEVEVWADVSARGWASEHPELVVFLRELGSITSIARGYQPFLAELDGQPAAAGGLFIHEGVALFAGAATAPEFRRRGLQGALLQYRTSYALEQGCDLAMMVTAPGTESQRNAERKGFQVAYTRTKWQLCG